MTSELEPGSSSGQQQSLEAAADMPQLGSEAAAGGAPAPAAAAPAASSEATDSDPPPPTKVGDKAG